VQVERLRDGTRKITRITEVVVSEGGEIRLRPLLHFELGTDDQQPASRLVGRHRLVATPSGEFADRARYFGEGDRLARVLGDMSEEPSALSPGERGAS